MEGKASSEKQLSFYPMLANCFVLEECLFTFLKMNFSPPNRSKVAAESKWISEISQNVHYLHFFPEKLMGSCR